MLSDLFNKSPENKKISYTCQIKIHMCIIIISIIYVQCCIPSPRNAVFPRILPVGLADFSIAPWLARGETRGDRAERSVDVARETRVVRSCQRSCLRVFAETR